MVLMVYWPETVRCWQTTVPRMAAVATRNNPTGEALYHLGTWLHLPAHAYLFGLNAVADHNAGGHTSYLLGMRSDKGWWYYFPVVFAVKSTMAALCAVLLLLAAALWQAIRREWISPMAMGLAIPPLFYFIFSMTSGINIGMRHILPVYPFLYVGTAALLSRLAAQQAARLRCSRWSHCRSANARASRRTIWPSSTNSPVVRGAVPSTWWIPISTGARTSRNWCTGWTHTAHDAPASFTSGMHRCATTAWMRWAIRSLSTRQGWNEVDDYCVASVTPLHGVYVPLVDLAPLRMREPIAKIGWSMYVYDLRKPKTAATAK